MLSGEGMLGLYFALGASADDAVLDPRIQAASGVAFVFAGNRHQTHLGTTFMGGSFDISFSNSGRTPR
jgi:hypothetical protein